LLLLFKALSFLSSYFATIEIKQFGGALPRFFQYNEVPGQGLALRDVRLEVGR
jgi:hypothetical protein